MKKTVLIFITLILIVPGLSAEDKYALVIGNSNYSGMGVLNNPVNDAEDMADTLRELDFTVQLHKNTDLLEFQEAVTLFRNRLSTDDTSIGVFYYAGHGVQSRGQNYLVPVDASIPSENYLQHRAFSVQILMDELKSSGNSLNMIILDACRDNPFSWSRSGDRGLSVVGSQPPGSIVVYATSAGSVAQDGTGRNGLFTSELLKHLKTPGLDVNDVFIKTGAGVQTRSGGRQIPAVYNQFFAEAYLAGQVTSPSRSPGFQAEAPAYGTIQVSLAETGTVYLDGARMGAVRGNGSAVLSDVEAGRHRIEIRYDGHTEYRTVTVAENRTVTAAFTWIEAPPEPEVPEDFIFVEGGTFRMGSTSGNDREKPVHYVTVGDFMIGKYEVTQSLYREVMGTNLSDSSKGIGDNYPVNRVNWFDAVEFCNKLSEKEGLEPVYRINGNNVTCDWSKNGYRLPTEAEWEFAARGGNSSRNYTYSGSNTIGNVAWYGSNSGSKTHPVGSKTANELGIYDMSGNVWEWCWDWYGSYSSGSQRDPRGASSGSDRVKRGGGWGYDASSSRTTNRDNNNPGNRRNPLGLRVVLPVVQ